MSSIAVLLQESAVDSLGRLTILALLKERMDGGRPDSRIRRRKSFKERMGGCCGGPIWGFQATTISVDDDEIQIREEEGDSEILHQLPQQQKPDATPRSGSDQACAADSTADVSASMNLAAERHYRAALEPEAAGGGGGGTDSTSGADLSEGPGTPLRVSLMRLLEAGTAVGSDSVCCVCMGRKKGAAFIPCGHAYCRVCSRELWLNPDGDGSLSSVKGLVTNVQVVSNLNWSGGDQTH